MPYTLHEHIILIFCALMVMERTLDRAMTHYCFACILFTSPLGKWLSVNDMKALARCPRIYVRRALMRCALCNLLDTRVNERVWNADHTVTRQYRELADEYLGHIEFFDYRIAARPRLMCA